ncbi:hypothetical protein HDU76_008833 [Blyttiomyces sp. JEL0837]|nr:hypothetical protein HDU76_008833 [Blyttiomyces sp. JEL0837]
MISEFKTKEDLIVAIMASCYIPILHETPVTIRTKANPNVPTLAISGAFTNPNPTYDSLTVTVSRIPGAGNWRSEGVAVVAEEPIINATPVSLPVQASKKKTAASVAPVVSAGNNKVDTCKAEGRRDGEAWFQMLWDSGIMTTLALQGFM